MATGTVADERTERKRELETTRKELDAAMAKYVAAEVAASSEAGAESHPALVDQRIRRAVVAAAREGLQAAYRADRSDGSALACGEVRRADAPRGPQGLAG